MTLIIFMDIYSKFLCFFFRNLLEVSVYLSLQANFNLKLQYLVSHYKHYQARVLG
jgi:hypothetical protein